MIFLLAIVLIGSNGGTVGESPIRFSFVTPTSVGGCGKPRATSVYESRLDNVPLLLVELLVDAIVAIEADGLRVGVFCR